MLSILYKCNGDLQRPGGATDESAEGAKTGMASLLRRAMQQAKAEAAAGTGLASHDSMSMQSADSQKAAGPGEKTVLAAMLRQAAQEIQDEEGPSAAKHEQEGSTTVARTLSSQSDSAEAVNSHDFAQNSQMSAAIDQGQMQLSGLVRQKSGSSSDSESGGPQKTQSLGQRLGSMLKNALSPSRQSSYVPLNADSPPEAEQAEQEVPGSSRRALPQDASLVQRMGSVLKGALSLPRQSSYSSLSCDEDFEPFEALEDMDRRRLWQDRKSFSRRPSGLLDTDKFEHVLSRELSLRERYGTPSLSRNSSYSSPPGNSHAELGGDHEPAVPLSPGKRRALPRDASYLPEWVTRSRGQTPRGHGSASPRHRLGTSVSSASTASDLEGDAAMPRWVDWPQPSPELSPHTAPPQADEEVQYDLHAAVPILMAPPHLQKQQQEHQKAAPSVPRAKRPLNFAPNPLSLSLVHTPSMNPQLDLRPMTPVATPKGQHLFDFWHQKSEQQQGPAATPPAPATRMAPANASEVCTSPVANGKQLADTPQLVPTAAQQAGSPPTAVLGDVAAASGIAYPAPPSAAVASPGQPQQHAETGAAVAQQADAGSGVQPGSASAAIIAELEVASRLVHQQSLQQAQLLAGIERTLSQLSQQRLLVQDPDAAALPSTEEDLLHDGRWPLKAEVRPVVCELSPAALTLLLWIRLLLCALNPCQFGSLQLLACIY